MDELFDILADFGRKRQAVALATVIETAGSVSAQVGAKAIIDTKGKVLKGWVGGGCAQSSVREAAVESIKCREPTIVYLDLDDEILGTGMPCGGNMKVYVEPLIPNAALWILGHGRIVECLCEIGSMLGLEVVVIDSLADPEQYSHATRVIVDDLDYSMLTPAPTDYVVVATQHKGDHHSIERAISLNAGYIGLIASRKRSRLIRRYLHERGHSDDGLACLFAPAGLAMGAKTREEIALAIASEIVMLRREGAGISRRDELSAATFQSERREASGIVYEEP
jgi:xanthine dehydrogenase accessory factor